MKNNFRCILLLLFFNFLFINSAISGIKVVKIPTSGTLELLSDQFPSELIKYNPSKIYVGYSKSCNLQFVKHDTITNLNGFIDSSNCKPDLFYRLIFKGKSGNIDSVWQFDIKYRVTNKAYPLGRDLLTILEYDTLSRVTDKFIFNYGRKLKEVYGVTKSVPLDLFMRVYDVYNSSDRNKYAVGSVWMLSIGIDDYGTEKYNNSRTDASSYVNFFEHQFLEQFKLVKSEETQTRGAFKQINPTEKDSMLYGGPQLNTYENTENYKFLFHPYLLTDSLANKESIIKALTDISIQATSNDYFIFVFSGLSVLLTKDSVNYSTYFCPFGIKDPYEIIKPKISDTSGILKDLISLKTLQDYIRLIPANNQLFISEAGPSKKFKTEFIKTLIDNSPQVASILNKNRIIIVPNNIGMDNIYCNHKSMKKGPLNYYITSLDSTYNIFEIFDNNNSSQIVYELKNNSFKCRIGSTDYFDVFFEKEFLNQYHEIFGDGEIQTRGGIIPYNKLNEAANFSGKKYALVIGTDNYSTQTWPNLSNPIYDAVEIAEELTNSYGYNVQLLKNPEMNMIYNALRNYYDSLNPSDQLILYFAGHGDFDEKFLDDGFIVCADSKSIDQDPVRNSYIQLTKLKKMINKIPASQILVLLDICHGGVFDDDVLGSKKRENLNKNSTNRNVLQFLKDNSQYKTRRMLSSVGKESAFDGKAGRHSPFANLLLQVLRAKGARSNGIVTLSNIYEVLQNASLNETATLKISPHKAGFGNDDVLGEFILIPEELKKTLK